MHVYSGTVPIVAERVTYWPGVSGASAQTEGSKSPPGDGEASEPASGSAMTTSADTPPLAYRDAVVGRPANAAAQAAHDAWVAAGRPPRRSGQATTLSSGGGWYGAHLTGPQPW